MTTTILIAVLACLVQVWGHIQYNRENGISPNLTSWSIWGFTSLIDAFNYQDMTQDWEKNLLPFTCAIACIATWGICLFKGKFKKPKASDYATFALCTISLIVWKKLDLVKEANFILQIDNVISFLPIIIGVALNPSTERPKAWMLWTVSYGLGTLVVVMRYEQWNDILFPAISAVLHFTVGALTFQKIRIWMLWLFGELELMLRLR